MEKQLYFLGFSRLAQHLITNLQQVGYDLSQLRILNRSLPTQESFFQTNETALSAQQFFQFELGKNALKLPLDPNSHSNSSKILIISIPPIKEQTQKIWSEFLELKARFFDQIVFISSTSVYKLPSDRHCLVSENSPVDENHPLILSEKIILKHIPHALILRPSGLFDKNSHPIHFLVKKEGELSSLTGTTNLVHRKDVARAIWFLLQESIGGIFNVSYPANPLKSDYYLDMASKLNLSFKGQMPNAEYPSKEINSQKLLALGFIYQQPIDQVPK